MDCWRVVVRVSVMGGGGGSCCGGRPRHGERLPFDSKLNRVLVRGLNN